MRKQTIITGAAVVAASLCVSATDAATVTGDTYVEIGDLFNANAPTQTRNTQPFISVIDDDSTPNNATGTLDRVGVLYFDLTSESGTGVSSGSSLSLTLIEDATGGASVDNPLTLSLWGVADGAAEDNFTNSGYAVTNTNALLNAIDAGGNRVRESNTFDLDPGAGTSFRELASIEFTSLAGLTDGSTITFASADLDTFVSSVTNGTDTDLAFLLTLNSGTSANGNGNGLSNNQLRFDSLETAGGTPATLAVVVPEPASALTVLGGLSLLGMRRRRA
ncbi:MAG: hypothetical protein AAGD32_04980 [Planctomycetota bacterium]